MLKWRVIQVGEGKMECSTGDVNGDGFLDVIVSKKISDEKWEVSYSFFPVIVVVLTH